MGYFFIAEQLRLFQDFLQFLCLCLLFFNTRGIESASKSSREWLLMQRGEDGGWGEDTPRAIVALHFDDESFFSGDLQSEVIAKQLEVQLAVELLGNYSETISTSQLALYVNALVATCRNPRNFHDMDLVAELKRRLHNIEDFPLVAISLCIANELLTRESLQLHNHIRMRSEKEDFEFWADRTALVLMALACHSPWPATEVNSLDYSRYLANAQNPDGSFGNIYTTAVVVQALSASGQGIWDISAAEEFISRHIDENGSYGNILATYLALPAAAGSNLASLRDRTCPPARVRKALPVTRSRTNIRYSLWFGEDHNVEYSMALEIPTNITFLEAMSVAAKIDNRFRFKSTIVAGHLNIYSISGKCSDPEKRLYWLWFMRNRNADHLARENLISLPHRELNIEIPSKRNHYIFWYKIRD